MFPANPPPSDSAREKGEENDRVLAVKVSPVSGEPYGGASDSKTKDAPRNDQKAATNE